MSTLVHAPTPPSSDDYLGTRMPARPVTVSKLYISGPLDASPSRARLAVNNQCGNDREEKGPARRHSLFLFGRQKEPCNKTRKFVFLALSSIIPLVDLENMSLAGKALVKAACRDPPTHLPPLRGKQTPFPGLDEAAKLLLQIWEACEGIHTNRQLFLRLTERCAIVLLAVRYEIAEASDEMEDELCANVKGLCHAFDQIHAFFTRRSLVRQFLQRDEIRAEFPDYEAALQEAMITFPLFIQTRSYSLIRWITAADQQRDFTDTAVF
ncbi:hypothetical protein F5I97DRAFT_262160 [Phlebopus sp. FC_14]|nr:hypothetical protein F5I97DRAFT_262160 [Phlebopus sp. FC_14]